MNKKELIKLLREIKDYRFDYHCDCQSCLKIRERIKQAILDNEFK